MPTKTTTPKTATPPDVQTGRVEEPLGFSDIQAVILSGYGHLPHAAYLFLRLARAGGTDQITPESRAALLVTLPDVTAAKHQKDSVKREKTALNLALTYGGLAALGHSRETLATFSPEFRGGMTEEYRSRALGDVQANDPKNWEWGGTALGPSGLPDFALLCFAHTHDALAEMVGGLKTRFGACGAVVVAEERSTPHMHGRSEHFGFRDNITSVHIKGGFGVRDPGQSVVAAGEFILGHPNEYGQKTAWPRINPTPTHAGADVGTNGAYLVFRKLEQDVPAF